MLFWNHYISKSKSATCGYFFWILGCIIMRYVQILVYLMANICDRIQQEWTFLEILTILFQTLYKISSDSKKIRPILVAKNASCTLEASCYEALLIVGLKICREILRKLVAKSVVLANNCGWFIFSENIYSVGMYLIRERLSL